MRKVIAAAATAMMLAAPAKAHTVLDQGEAPAGSLYTARIRVMDGCGASPTKRLRVELPQSVTRVTPRAQPGWQVRIERKPLPQPFELHGRMVTEYVSAIEWTGGLLQADAFDEFQIRMALPDAAGTVLHFPTTQECVSGIQHWREVPAAGAAPTSVEYPAPALRLLPR